MFLAMSNVDDVGAHHAPEKDRKHRLQKCLPLLALICFDTTCALGGFGQLHSAFVRVTVYRKWRGPNLEAGS
jgi:hypothetical protein